MGLGVLGNALAFVVVIAILVTVHEFGHFWVARRCGIKVLRFSLGFGRVIARRQGRDGTEYAVSAIPLGGYVKMLDETEGEVPVAEQHRAFNRQRLWRRNAVIVAGPLFNFLFAILVYWVLFGMGETVLRPVLDEVPADTPAAAAGFQTGDEIQTVAGESVTGWRDVIKQVMGSGAGNPALPVTVVTPSGERITRKLDVARIGPLGQDPDILGALGWQPARPALPTRIAEVEAGSAAARAGLSEGDRIVAVDAEPIERWRQLADAVRDATGETLPLTLVGDGGRRTLEVAVPAAGKIGVRADPPSDAMRERYTRDVEYGPLEALGRGVGETWAQGQLMLTVSWQMVTGAASTRNISGPVSIAEFAGDSMTMGLRAFLTLLAVISISLGVVNLLPVPVLPLQELAQRSGGECKGFGEGDSCVPLPGACGAGASCGEGIQGVGVVEAGSKVWLVPDLVAFRSSRPKWELGPSPLLGLGKR